MTWLLVIDLVICALAIGVRVPALRHYLRNWKARTRRNPESAALAIEIGMNQFGALMAAVGCIGTYGARGPVVMTIGISCAVGINLLAAIWTARRLYEAQDERQGTNGSDGSAT